MDLYKKSAEHKVLVVKFGSLKNKEDIVSINTESSGCNNFQLAYICSYDP